MAAGSLPLAAQISPHNRRAVVSLVRDEDRRKNVYNALAAIDDQIRPVLKRKKYVRAGRNTTRWAGGWLRGSRVSPSRARGPSAVVAPRGQVTWLSE